MSAIPPPLPSASRQIPNNLLHELFGEVNVSVHADRLDVTATILLEPNKEGSQTGVALDGSASMRKALGQGWAYAAHYDARDASLKKDTEEDFRKRLDASRWGTPW